MTEQTSETQHASPFPVIDSLVDRTIYGLPSRRGGKLFRVVSPSDSYAEFYREGRNGPAPAVGRRASEALLLMAWREYSFKQAFDAHMALCNAEYAKGVPIGKLPGFTLTKELKKQLTTPNFGKQTVLWGLDLWMQTPDGTPTGHTFVIGRPTKGDASGVVVSLYKDLAGRKVIPHAEFPAKNSEQAFHRMYSFFAEIGGLYLKQQ